MKSASARVGLHRAELPHETSETQCHLGHRQAFAVTEVLTITPHCGLASSDLGEPRPQHWKRAQRKTSCVALGKAAFRQIQLIE